MACLLKSRSVIRFRGPETIRFLQGLVTNDVRGLDNPKPVPENSFTLNMPVVAAPPVYAAMLTPKGRFLFDFFFYRPSRLDEKLDRTGSGPGPDPCDMEIYADVDKDEVDELVTTLKRYRLRSKVDIEDASGDFSCWQRFGEDLPRSSISLPESGSVGWGGAIDDTGVLSSGGDFHGWHWNRDPRLACLGHRGIFPSHETPPLVEADTETDEANFLVWRMEKGVAEGSTEIPKGDAVPLEYNLAGLNAISFDKGCYIGQELVARTHHRGEIRKRLMPLKFFHDREEEIAPGSEVINGETQRKAGMVTTVAGSRGLGLIRLDEAFGGTSRFTIKGREDVLVQADKPEWWPSQWLPES